MKAQTLNDVLAPSLMALAAGIDTQQGRPRLVPGTSAYRYAVLVLTGSSHTEAAGFVGVTDRHARRLREDLENQALLYFGKPTNYEFAARYALCSELRTLCVRLRTLSRSHPLPKGGNQP